MMAGWTAVVLIIGVVGCSKKGASAADTAAAPAVVVADPAAGVAVAVPADAPVELQVAAPRGHPLMLADASGRAVYILTDAKGNVTECTGDCAKSFTPVTGTGVAKAGDSTIKANLAGTTTNASGGKQATYNGKPLYYYTGDTNPGDTKGNNVKAGTATAHLVSPTGMAAK
jgi:predicted lipoprotein with Yx(FWY)xxD motif